MDSFDVVIVCFVIAVLMAVSALFAYTSGQNNVREQAVAKGVACYTINKETGGVGQFSWSCSAVKP